MQVIVRHDDTIHGSQRLTELATTTVESYLNQKYAEHITTVEVFFADENGKKSTGDDIRCTIEVRFVGHGPTAVTHHASDLQDALTGATEKVWRALDHHIGRLRHHTVHLR